MQMGVEVQGGGLPHPPLLTITHQRDFPYHFYGPDFLHRLIEGGISRQSVLTLQFGTDGLKPMQSMRQFHTLRVKIILTLLEEIVLYFLLPVPP